MSYIEEENGKLVGKGVAFKVLEFLTEKFNFSINIVKLEKDIIGAQTEYKGSLVECLNESVCTFRQIIIMKSAEIFPFLDLRSIEGRFGGSIHTAAGPHTQSHHLFDLNIG